LLQSANNRGEGGAVEFASKGTHNNNESSKKEKRITRKQGKNHTIGDTSTRAGKKQC